MRGTVNKLTYSYDKKNRNRYRKYRRTMLINKKPVCPSCNLVLNKQEKGWYFHCWNCYMFVHALCLVDMINFVCHRCSRGEL